MNKCSVCDDPAVDGRTRCEYHLQRARDVSKNRRDRLVNNGLCTACNIRPPEMGKKNCAKCRARRTEWQRKDRAKKREQGLCYACGKPTQDGKTYCIHCQGFNYHGDPCKKSGSKRGEAFVRDSGTCKICGSTKKVSVHHIDGKGYGDDVPNHSIDNLITVCENCHRSIHDLRRRLSTIPCSTDILHYAQLLP